MKTIRPALASLLCALPLLASCSASNTPPAVEDDVPVDTAPVDTGDDVPSIDAAPDAPEDTAAPDVAPDAAPDLPVDAAPDVAEDTATPDVVEDIATPDAAPDASCRARCSGFCSDPDTDLHNCGLCGNDCTLRAGVDGSRVRCEAGRCVFTGACLPGRANCSGNPDDGCEAIVTTALRCGSCGTTCTADAPNCVPMASAPGGYACSSGCVAPFNARCSSVCVDTNTDARNCGACGNVCPTGVRGTPACVMGRCTLTCTTGYGDCDGNPANGCETVTTTNVNHCGMCGNVCLPGPSGAPLCTAGVCSISCAAGTGNCDGMAANGCETDTRTSVMNCGTCGNACPARANSTSTCAAGLCGVVCASGFGNCNAVVTDGCEANLASDPLNCGACARRCAAATNATATCAMGTCGIACTTNYGNCDGNGLNGCETALATDPRNCGACGTVCPAATGATATCTAGRCGLACMTGAGDCNANPADGCETDTTTSNANCGACGVACNAPSDGTARCVASRCAITCNAGYVLSGSLCVRQPPRPVYPPPGALVTSRRPTFRVALPAGQNGARVEICGDRTCTSVATTINATSARIDSPATLSLNPGTYYWRVTGLIGTSAVTTPSPVIEFTVTAGSAAAVGSYWGQIFDPGNDRFADLLGGVPSSLYAQHWTNTSGSLSSSLYTTRSGTTSFATAVASAGDVNGDGAIDALVGAPSVNTVSVFLSTGSALATTASAVLPAPTGTTQFGASVAPAGDVNGDGFGDVLVGAPGSNRAYLYLGTATGIEATATPQRLIPTGASSNFGVSVAGLGDVNADGYGDVAVGTNGGDIVYVWYGGASGLGATPTGLSSPVGANGFGRAVAGAGDVNGDGYPDVIVGAFNSSTAYVFFGSATGLGTVPDVTITGTGSQFGASVDGVGDVNGDGFGDVLIGASGGDRAYVYTGRAGGLNAAAAFTLSPTYAGYAFGTAVTGFGDFNNDGYGDFAVTSLNRAIQIYRGTATGPVLYATFIGSTSFGTSLAARGTRFFTPRS